MRQGLCAILAALALTGCASVREADVRLPGDFLAPQRQALPAADLDRWWPAFEDPELTALMDRALVEAPDARTAAARLAEARASRTSSLLGFLPQGGINGQASRTDTEQLDGTVVSIPGFSTSGVSESYTANFNVSWELDLFGRFFAARRAGNADVAGVRFQAEATRASLAAAVADSWFASKGLAIQLEDARETARIQRALADIVGTRAERGLAPTSEADRIAGDLAQAEAQVAALEAELQAARRSLLVLVGRGAEDLSVVPAEPELPAAPGVPETLPSELLARRPDVREAQARITSAAGRLDLTSLQLLPTLTLTPGIGWARNEQPGFFSETRSETLGGRVSIPVLEIPRILTDIRAQSARAEQAVIAYEKTVQTAFGEAENALVQLAADRRRVELLAAGEARAARAYEASRVGYARGLIDLENALAAERAWRGARSQLTAARVQMLRRTVQAYQALGGGWNSDLNDRTESARS